MKFSDKYELVERITTGPVRAFIARELASRVRVVIYIFECSGDHSGQMAGQWVLQAFRNLAPSPPGQALEAGGDEKTSYAYLVTQMPEAAALKAWIQAYKVHSGKTGDLPKDSRPGETTTDSMDLKNFRESVKREGISKAETAAEDATSGDINAPGEFTKAFWDLAGKPPAADVSEISPTATPSKSSTRASVPDPDARTAEPFSPRTSPLREPVQSEPAGEFTEAFMDLRAPSRPLKVAPSPNPVAELPAKSRSNVGDDEPGVDYPGGPQRPQPGAFTKQFLSALDVPFKPAEPVQAPVPVEQPRSRSQGAFTREFLQATGSTPDESAGKVSSAIAPPGLISKDNAAVDSVRQSDSEAGSFTGPSTNRAAERKVSTRNLESSPAIDKAGTGEFTNFFGGPFQAPAPSPVAELSPEPIAPPRRPEPGDFTRMFGSFKGGQAAPESSPAAASLQSAANSVPELDFRPKSAPVGSPGAFTRMFIPDQVQSEGEIAPALERAEPGTFSRPPGSMTEAKIMPSSSKGSSEPPGKVSWPEGSRLNKDAVIPAAETFMPRSTAGGATQVFVPRGTEPAPFTSAVPSGPSEFTRIISGGASGPSPSTEPAAASTGPTGAPAGPTPPGFAMPQMPAMQLPQMPAVPGRQMPGMGAPKIPGMAMPQMTPMSMSPISGLSMPQMASPQVPPMPKAELPASGAKIPYLPLIIIFNILLIAAVLIVLYFAFKH